MKKLYIVTAKLAKLILVSALIIISIGCAPKGEGFAIYLTREDIPPARMPVLSHVDLAEQPIITITDIITYTGATHEIKLTEESYKRISSLKVPVSGKSFVVCVDRKPIYWGAFWTPLSSVSFSGIVITVLPLSPREDNTIRLETGYPAPSFASGEDPRLNAEVMKSLAQSGKLK